MQSISDYIRHRSEVYQQNNVEGAEYSCVPENWEVDELLDNACLKVNGGYILNIGKLDDYDVFLKVQIIKGVLVLSFHEPEREMEFPFRGRKSK